MQVAVCGPRECSDGEGGLGRMVGRLLAEAGVTVWGGGGAPV